MRILHVTDAYRPRVGGIEVFVEDLARRQAGAGHQVTVLTASPSSDSRPDDAGPARVVRTPLSVLHPLAPPAARETALSGAYDVVHAHLSVVSPFATAVARAAEEAGIATVKTVHSMWGGRGPAVRAVRALAGWDRSAAVWTTVSRAAAADMHEVLCSRAVVHVVANAVDVSWWCPSEPPPSRPCVTFASVMRLAGRKRPLALVDLLERMRIAVPDTVAVRAVIVGEGPLERRVRAELVRRGLDDWVTMAGQRSRTEIRGLFRAADVYVAPAYQESFGIAALEARAAGLPVVAMQTGGVGEFIDHGVEGLLCRDDHEMALALTALAGDPGLRRALARHNAATPPTHDWPRALAGFDTAYAEARRQVDTVRQRGDVLVLRSSTSASNIGAGSASTSLRRVGR
jgi:glycosyltransferase involved in cell wall biosynthesis